MCILDSRSGSCSRPAKNGLASGLRQQTSAVERTPTHHSFFHLHFCLCLRPPVHTLHRTLCVSLCPVVHTHTSSSLSNTWELSCYLSHPVRHWRTDPTRANIIECIISMLTSHLEGVRQTEGRLVHKLHCSDGVQRHAALLLTHSLHEIQNTESPTVASAEIHRSPPPRAAVRPYHRLARDKRGEI